MIWAALALWAGLAGELLPDLPPLELEYLGAPGVVRPDGIAGLRATEAGAATAVLFRGAFDFGGASALETALDGAPWVRLVAFDSPGGRPLVADGVAQLIRARHLDTTVEGFCASACTIAYSAGTVRTAGPRARFLFHLGTGPLLAGTLATMVVQIERKWFLRGGISLSFGERALHAPNEEPYRAPLDELMAAGYVHRVLSAREGARPARGLLAAVAAIEPQTAERLANASTQGLPPGATPDRVAAIADQRAALVVDRWFGRSSDAAVAGLVDAKLAALEWLAGQDGYACMRWQIGRDNQELSLMQLPAGLRDSLRAAQEAVLRDANVYPAVAADEDGALAAADGAVRRSVAAAYGSRALANAGSPEHGFDDPTLSCTAGTAYLRGLRDRPEGVRLVRWAFGAG